MTKGSPARHILGFAAPLVLGNLFQQLYAVVDTMVLGRGVGVDALAAAGSTGSLNFFVLGFIVGLTHGYSILISQRFGAADYEGVRRAAANSLYLAVLSSLVITTLSVALSRWMMGLMQTPPELLEDALVYIRIIFLGTFATVLYNMLSGILRALGDGVSPLVILVISAFVNAGLDVLFVVTFHWGVAGAAWATVLAQMLSALMCLLVLARVDVMRMRREDWRADGAALARLLKLGVPVGVMNSITAIGSMVLQGVVNRMGAVTIAAYTTGSRLVNLAAQPPDILGMALGTYVGQNLGAGRLDRIRAGVRRTIQMSLGVSAAMGLVLVLFGRQLTGIFFTGTEQAVIDAAYPYYLVTGSAMWVLGLLFLYRFALQSLGDTVVPMLSGVLELLMRLSVVGVLHSAFHLEFWAVCFAEISAWTGAGLMLAIGYYVRMGRLSRRMESAR